MTRKKVISGSPLKCGAYLFMKIVLPAIKAAAKAMMSKDDLFMLYTGLFSAMYGAMVADFGKSGADTLAETLLEKFAEMPDPSGSATPPANGAPPAPTVH
jgi:uncharacterized membrane protein